MGEALHLDFESRSCCDLRKRGLDAYTSDPTTEPLCMAWAFGDEAPDIWLPGQPLPDRVREHVSNGGLVYAHNAQFELAVWNRICVPRLGWPELKAEQTRCTMAMAYAMALPGALGDVASALGLEQRKDHFGQRVMMQLCRPRKRWLPGDKDYATAKAQADHEAVYAEGRPFVRLPSGEVIAWWDDAAKYAELYAYCKNDVRTERAVHARLMELSPTEQAVWVLDQKINNYGVRLDIPAVHGAIALVEGEKGRMNAEMRLATGGHVEKCSQGAKLTEWLCAQGCITPGVNKADVKALLEDEDLPGDLTAEVEQMFSPPGTEIVGNVRKALELRKEANRASTAKLSKMLDVVNEDGLVRFIMQYHAASTGRWGGRKIQPQNFPRPARGFEGLEIQNDIIAAVSNGWSADRIRLFFGQPMEAIASVLRGLLLPHEGRELIVGDYSNVEGRGLSWAAGDEKKLDIFRAQDNGTGPEVYLATGAEIFGVDIRTLTKASFERLIGKIAELALGYGGAEGAFKAMMKAFGLNEIEAGLLKRIIVGWRNAHPLVAGVPDDRGFRSGGYWADLETAAMAAVRNPGSKYSAGAAGREITYLVNGSFLWARLPSGRPLCYPYPEIREVITPWGKPKLAVTFKSAVGGSGAKSTKRVPDHDNTGKWARVSTHGGVLCENVVQALCRDLLAEAMIRLDRRGLPILLHVHDEIVGDTRKDSPPEVLAAFTEEMARVPPWAAGFPIVVDSFRSARYGKH